MKIKFPCYECLIVSICEKSCDKFDEATLQKQWKRWCRSCLNNNICPYCNSKVNILSNDVVECSVCIEDFNRSYYHVKK